MGKLDFTTHQGNSESLLAQVPFQDRTRRVCIDVTPIGIAEEALGLPARRALQLPAVKDPREGTKHRTRCGRCSLVRSGSDRLSRPDLRHFAANAHRV